MLIDVNCLESNEVLKLKFRKLHMTVVNSVNPANVIDFLFQEAVIGHEDVSTLRLKEDPCNCTLPSRRSHISSG